ncbi:trypsin-like peptidase domain-containing protein [bacterium]|nr:trypsin-like peptidase domain-containing protein [bacterium]MBU1651530.1 trypsin-like peptidase domain-containing protein [bacterium]
MKVWRELLLGFLLGAVVFLGYREYRRSTAWVTQQTPAQQEQTQFDPASLEPGSDATGLTDEINQHRGNAITRTIQEVSPAVVGINVTQVREYRTRNPLWDDPFFRELFPQRIYRKNVENLGSGFLISPNGLVITNEHVVHNATEILITMTSGEEFEALIIGADYYSDIALLKINGENLPYARMGDSDDVIIGEWSIALGNPFGLFSYNDQPTATVGVVSATNRDFNRTSEGRIYKDMIQTDAAINRGNSGGALVNSLGDVIGMSTLIFSEGGGSLGIGFAIPINRIKEIVQELQATGAVNRNYWTGLSIQNLDRLIALSMKLPTTDGVIVTDIEPLSPGEKGGFQVADVILAINNQPVKNYNSVRSYLENEDLRVGDELIFTINRDGDNKQLKLILEEMPK